MAVQTQLNITTVPFIRNGIAETEELTIQQDAGRTAILYPMTVMGKATVLAGTVVAGTNTGNGTCTAFALAGGREVPIVGSYVVECILAGVTHGGTFKLTDPNGVILDSAICMPDTATGVRVYVGHGITFTLTDGSTNFAVGDDFSLPVTTVNKYVPLNIDGVNGSQIVRGIFVGDAISAATLVAGDVAAQSIMTGGGAVYVDKNMLIFEGGETLATILPCGDTIKEALAKLGIKCIDTIDISAYEA